MFTTSVGPVRAHHHHHRHHHTTRNKGLSGVPSSRFVYNVPEANSSYKSSTLDYCRNLLPRYEFLWEPFFHYFRYITTTKCPIKSYSSTQTICAAVKLADFNPDKRRVQFSARRFILCEIKLITFIYALADFQLNYLFSFKINEHEITFIEIAYLTCRLQNNPNLAI